MTGKRKNANHWGICPICMYERPTINDIMKPHNVYIRPSGYADEVGIMVPCEGSGKPPLPPFRHGNYNIFKGVKTING